MKPIPSDVLNLIGAIDNAALDLIHHHSKIDTTTNVAAVAILCLAQDVWEYGGNPPEGTSDASALHQTSDEWDRRPVELLLGMFIDAALYYRAGIIDASELAERLPLPEAAAVSLTQLLVRVDFWMNLLFAHRSL